MPLLMVHNSLWSAYIIRGILIASYSCIGEVRIPALRLLGMAENMAPDIGLLVKCTHCPGEEHLTCQAGPCEGCAQERGESH